MAEMLLVNPRRRAKRSATKRRARPAARAAAPARRRRRNPIGLARVARRPARRSVRRAVSRRRNPINLGGSAGGIMAQVQNALLGGVGAVGVDVLMGQINPFLPASMRRTPGTVGVGDAVKMGITILAGQLLKKPTRGMSAKMAAGALTCQARDILAGFVPATMTLGYASPGRVVRGVNRVGPIMSRMQPGTVGAYNRPGGTSPLLSAYNRPGVSPLLSSARSREGVSQWR